MKQSEASKASEASEASKSSQARYASTASPQILYYLKSASVAAKSAPRRPGDLFGDPPSNFGEPRKPPDFILPKISFRGSENRPRGAPRHFFGRFWDPPPEIVGSPGRNNKPVVAPLGPKIC